MNYERLEDILTRLTAVNSEIREIRREISVISDRIRDVNRDIRRYTSLYQETMREMYRLYGRVSWLERRGLYEEARKLRAEAQVLYAEARGYTAWNHQSKQQHTAYASACTDLKRGSPMP